LAPEIWSLIARKISDQSTALPRGVWLGNKLLIW
jgi:hypothetical protein